MGARIEYVAPGQLREPGGLWRAIVQWLRENASAAATSVLMGAVFGYAVTFMMTRVFFQGPESFDGSRGVFGGLLRSSLLSGVLTTIVFGFIGYRRAVGKQRAWQAVREAPGTIALLFRHDGQSARAHLLSGAAIAFVSTQVVSPWLGATVAVGLLSALPSAIGRMIATIASRLWSKVVRALAPSKGQPVDGSLGMAVGMVGSSAALLVGFLIRNGAVRIALAGLCLLGVILRRSRAPRVALPLLLIGLGTLLGQTLHDLLSPLLAFADRPIPGEMGGLLTGHSPARQTGAGIFSLGSAVVAGATAPIAVGAGNILGQLPSGAGWNLPAPLGSPAPSADPSPGRAKALRGRLNQLDLEVQDPDLWRRVDALKAKARAGEIDEDELAGLEAMQDDLARRRTGEIEKDQEKATGDFRARQKKQHDEKRERDQRNARLRQQFEDQARGAANRSARAMNLVDRSYGRIFQPDGTVDPDALEQLMGDLKRERRAVENASSGSSEAELAQWDARINHLQEVRFGLAMANVAVGAVANLPGALTAPGAAVGAVEGATEGIAEHGLKGILPGAVGGVLLGAGAEATLGRAITWAAGKAVEKLPVLGRDVGELLAGGAGNSVPNLGSVGPGEPRPYHDVPGDQDYRLLPPERPIPAAEGRGTAPPPDENVIDATEAIADAVGTGGPLDLPAAIPPPSKELQPMAYGKQWEQYQLQRGIDPRDPNVQELDLNMFVKQWGTRETWAGRKPAYHWSRDESPVVDAVGVKNGEVEYLASMMAAHPNNANPDYLPKFDKVMDFTESNKRGAAELRKAVGFEGTDMEMLEKVELHVPDEHVDGARAALENSIRENGFGRYQGYADHLKAKGFSPEAIVENLKSKIVGR